MSIAATTKITTTNIANVHSKHSSSMDSITFVPLKDSIHHQKLNSMKTNQHYYKHNQHHHVLNHTQNQQNHHHQQNNSTMKLNHLVTADTSLPGKHHSINSHTGHELESSNTINNNNPNSLIMNSSNNNNMGNAGSATVPSSSSLGMTTVSKRSASYSSLMDQVPPTSSRSATISRRSSTDISSIWSTESSYLDLAHVSSKRTFNSLLLNESFTDPLMKSSTSNSNTLVSLNGAANASNANVVNSMIVGSLHSESSPSSSTSFMLPSSASHSTLHHSSSSLNNMISNDGFMLYQDAFSSSKLSSGVNHTNTTVASSSMMELKQQQQPTFCRFFAQGFCSKASSNSTVASSLLSPSVTQTTFPAIQKSKVKKITGDDTDRFNGVSLTDLLSQVYLLCTDQHGCRYLQKKLEERIQYQTDLIFNHVFPHYVQLMTDPFGNYLCQRLMEFCSDSQRVAIVDMIAPHLASIALNMHGTRAVQKMFDFLTNNPVPPNANQLIHRLSLGLARHVVALIKDLNGNHVVQKCLVRLTAQQNQFIFDAVSQCCVQVSTHRHGCCVLQRCIDYATDAQKLQLISEITFHALTLVQDPFGNYVVQYVLDLGNPMFANCIVKSFLGHVCVLSVQKFSSNVIEKAIRVADAEVRALLVNELLVQEKLENLLKDLYANYVVQTALDCCDPIQRMKLVECIKPVLPLIRNTPFGKRIQNKISRMHQSTVNNSYYHQSQIPAHLPLTIDNNIHQQRQPKAYSHQQLTLQTQPFPSVNYHSIQDSEYLHTLTSFNGLYM